MFYIIDTVLGNVYKTPDLHMAQKYAACEDAFVIDADKELWLLSEDAKTINVLDEQATE